MNKIKKIFLWSGILVVTLILGLVYVFVGNKYKTASIKIGENVFKSEIAETSAQKAKGLAYRDGIEKNGAMFFDFKVDGKYPFWMMGMRFPIDIIWIKDDRVVGIEKNVLAPSLDAPVSGLKVYYPPEEINKVLEISAGGCDELGIKIGDNFVILK